MLSPIPEVEEECVEEVEEQKAVAEVEEERKVYVWGDEYVIRLPPGFDIYEGMRLWYPALYAAVIEEENYLKREEADFCAYDITEETERELMWERQDYLEWLFD